jgi:ABC-type proline/glycine betaine transport system ATPase subunit
MKDGAIVQEGTINDLIKSPANDFVTKFIKAQRSMFEIKN